MGAALAIRRDLLSADDLRTLARRERNRRTATRMLAIANALDGMSRTQAARLVGLERQAFARCGAALQRRRAHRPARSPEARPPSDPERGRAGAAARQGVAA